MQGNLAHQHFSCLAELQRDSGLIGQVLSSYPDLIRPADSDAEWQFDYQTKHQDPKRLPLPDPWQFLFGSPAVTERDKAVFRAAQSQLRALRHLCHIGQRFATLETDWYQEWLEARAEVGLERRCNHAIGKIVDAQILNERVQRHMQGQCDPEMLREMKRLQKERRDQLVHDCEKERIEQLKQWPSWSKFRNENRLLVMLVEWWVRHGTSGVPGFMFWRNDALTEFLFQFALDGRERAKHGNLGRDYIKGIRQDLGLVPVGQHQHFVWDISFKANAQGKCELITGSWKNGKKCFWPCPST